MNKKIPVTQPFLPELNEFIPYLEQIWIINGLQIMAHSIRN
jgi:hypothetical protein